MTWQHLQQLRATARGTIQQMLAEKQPAAGRGASVQGSSIGLQPDRRNLPRPREKPWILVIYASVTYESKGGDGQGDSWANSGSFAREVFVSQDVLGLHGTYAYEKTQFFNLTPSRGSGAWHTRNCTIEFEVRAFDGDRIGEYEDSYYRMPVEVTLTHETYGWGKPREVVSRRKLRLGHGITTYSPKPEINDDGLYVHIREIRHRL